MLDYAQSFPVRLLLVLAVFSELILAEEIDPPQPALTEAEKLKLDALIRQLDSDSFDRRHEARAALIDLGEGAINYCSAQLLSNQTLSAEVRHALRGLSSGFEKKRMEQFLAEIELAVKESPKRYIAPNPTILRKLQTVKTNGNENVTVQEHLAGMPGLTGVRFVTDPAASEVLQGLSGHSSGDLTAIEDLKSMLLDGVRAAPDENADFVLRGDTIILTTEARAEKLRLREATLKLPVLPGEAAWTLAQTNRLLDILAVMPFENTPWYSDLNHPRICYQELLLKFTQSKPAEPGILHICAGHEVIRLLEFFFDRTFARELPPLEPNTPAWETMLGEKLDQKLTFELTGLDEKTFADKVSSQIGISLGSIARAKCPAEVSARNVTLRDFLRKLARDNRWSLHPAEEVWRPGPRHPGFAFHAIAYNSVTSVIGDRFLLDLRPALDKGVSANELVNRLDEILADAQLTDEAMKADDRSDFRKNGCFHSRAFELRGRFFGRADPWTLRRMSTVVDQAAKTGKVPAAPPKPWFFETWPLKSSLK